MISLQQGGESIEFYVFFKKADRAAVFMVRQDIVTYVFFRFSVISAYLIFQTKPPDKTAFFACAKSTSTTKITVRQAESTA